MQGIGRSPPKSLRGRKALHICECLCLISQCEFLLDYQPDYLHRQAGELPKLLPNVHVVCCDILISQMTSAIIIKSSEGHTEQDIYEDP